MNKKTNLFERIKLSVLVFIVLFVFTVPFPLQSVWNPVYYFEKYIIDFEFFFVRFFVYDYPFQKHFYSDSPDLFVHLYFLIIISISVALIFYKKLHQKKIGQFLPIISSYLLAFFLIKYGFDKVFKLQFYYPEPNILHTEFGKLDKDILFWSTMGKSYSYNVFMGLIEIIPGIFLFFRKTRKLGALIAFGVLLNVLVLNFSYGIDVKILSSFLLFLSLIILNYYRKELISFFLKSDHSVTKKTESFEFKHKSYVKFALIFFIFFESTFLAISSSNINDDNAPRPKFHGSYQLISDSKLTHELLGITKNARSEIKFTKLFFHRKNNLIFKDLNGLFYSYKLRSFSENSYYNPENKLNINISKTKANKYLFNLQKDSLSETIVALKIQD
jgi:hypothetical protein